MQIELKTLLPSVSAEEILLQQPWILREGEWQDSIRHIQRMIKDCGIDTVSSQVLMNVEVVSPYTYGSERPYGDTKIYYYDDYYVD